MKSEFRDDVDEDRPPGGEPGRSRPSADHYASDCPMAGHQIESGLDGDQAPPTHPLKLLRMAYGI